MNAYTRLAREERYQMRALLDAGCSQSAIARTLGRARSTTSREIRRNRGKRGYRPKQTHQTSQRRESSKHRYRLPAQIGTRVVALIKLKWSPEQISGWLSSRQEVSISHQWIYQYVRNNQRQGGDLHTHLRCQKKRKKRYGRTDVGQRGQIKGRVSIDQRLPEVDQRSRIGDREVDTVVGAYQGSKPVLVTLTERKTRLSVITKANNKTA